MPGVAPTSHDVFDYVELKGNTLGPLCLLPAVAGLLFSREQWVTSLLPCKHLSGPGAAAPQAPLPLGLPAPQPPCSSAPLLHRQPCLSGTPLLLRYSCPLASLLLSTPAPRLPVLLARSAHRSHSPARGHSSFSTKGPLRLPSSTERLSYPVSSVWVPGKV